MNSAAKPLASLSLDLDDKWSYLKTHGDASWRELPSYLNVVIPRTLKFLAERRLVITYFVVGLDACQPANQSALRSLADAGHEIGCHSHHHEPWLHLYSEEQIDRELATAEKSIYTATGKTPLGFRGPGFSLSESVLRILVRRGYRYDASTFPTYLGPLARAYYLATAKLTPTERRQRSQLFGKFQEGNRPLQPYQWKLNLGRMLEIPVTTMPLTRLPIHVSYLLYLSTFSKALGLAYFRMAVQLCVWTRTPLSLLLHPLDFMGSDDDADLSFFPGMRTCSAVKIAFVSQIMEMLTSAFTPCTMLAHADEAKKKPRLRTIQPRF